MTSVVHVTQPTTGGVARVVLGLACAQRAQGFETAVACPDGPLAERLTAAGVRWLPWESRREPAKGVASERQALREILDRAAPDLVHLHSSKAGLVGRLAVRGRIPTVFQPHAWSFLAVEGRTRLAAIRWERFATRWTDMTLFCSWQEQREGFDEGIAGVGRVVLNGVDLTAMRVPTAAERAAARRSLGVSEDAFVATVVGRRSYQKGQDVAVKAWQQVRAEEGSATLLLVGEGYTNEADWQRGIVTRAPLDDVRPVLRAADVILSPSRWEGLSLSLLEGMASGRPTIATNVAGSQEALINGPLPAAGSVVEPENSAALAREIVKRLRQRELVGREANAARMRAETLFDESATAASVSAAYRLLPGIPRAAA
ncbi:glycosyltransferase [Actinoplanes sp. NPDC049548]|uniref:glycosyltransferase n=1 Tax=Actinoplanes sp. NPDC049548 TaxID=3155152 RepID=UPI0034273CF6